MVKFSIIVSDSCNSELQELVVLKKRSKSYIINVAIERFLFAIKKKKSGGEKCN